MLVYLDLETTGLNTTAEILEIGILSESGEILLQTYVKPVNHTKWPDAQRIHKISPKDVENAPSLDDIRAKIIVAIKEKTVIIYNAGFDTKFLDNELNHAAQIKCCMIEFATIYGDFNEYRGSYKWQKLEVATDYVGFKCERLHSAIEDCRATRAVWEYCMANDEARQKIDEQYREELWVNYYLEQVDYDKQAEIEEFLDEMNAFWCKWLGIITENAIYQKHHIREEELYQAFTGYTKRIWELVSEYESLELPKYQTRKQIPSNLTSFSGIKKLQPPLWVSERIQRHPVGCFLSTSRKTIYLLYDTKEIEQIIATMPNRYEDWALVPGNLVSQTKLKREYRVDVNKTKQKPVADAKLYTRHGIGYIPLYEIPQMPKVLTLEPLTL